MTRGMLVVLFVASVIDLIAISVLPWEQVSVFAGAFVLKVVGLGSHWILAGRDADGRDTDRG